MNCLCKITLRIFFGLLFATNINCAEVEVLEQEDLIKLLRDSRKALESFVGGGSPDAPFAAEESERIILILYCYSLNYKWNEALEKEILGIQLAAWNSSFSNVSIMGLPEPARREPARKSLRDFQSEGIFQRTIPLIEALPLCVEMILKNGGSSTTFRSFGYPRSEEASEYYKMLKRLKSDSVAE